MELVYLINNKHDFDKFASIYPNATWADKGAFTFNYLQLLLEVRSVNLPVALYCSPAGKVEWSNHSTALRLTSESPYEYQWAELWPKLSTIDIFRKFLQHYNAYEAFEIAHQNDTNPTLSAYTKDIVSSAFIWEYSKETVSYWSNLDDKWRKLVQDLQLPNERIDNFYQQLFLIDGETNDNT